jgi:hypothetical protein
VTFSLEFASESVFQGETLPLLVHLRSQLPLAAQFDQLQLEFAVCFSVLCCDVFVAFVVWFLLTLDCYCPLRFDYGWSHAFRSLLRFRD